MIRDMLESDNLAVALDALEGMVEQFFDDPGDGTLRHSFMSAEEFAADILASLRPERWELIRSGLRKRVEERLDVRS